MVSDVRIIEGDLSVPEALDDLIRRAQAGEESAFEAILDRFEARAILIARGMGASRQDAEDIAQEAFLKIFRYIGSYRRDQTFKAYFYRIVINASRDHLARMRPAGQSPLEGLDEMPAEPERRASYEDVEMLRRALQELPGREREVVILRDLQGLSTWEVARILRISPITVRRHSSRALAHLRKILK
ncbi:MAG TPA: RNA polymerase sigma factor [Candidatus Polarisedimenticolia bacterium]|jgi:RNA polymerase sigma-70 factor (ECF subfamily)